MGDVEQLVAEPDEVDVVDENEDIDGVHPHTLGHQHPWIVTQLLRSVTLLFSSYGWYCVGFSLLAYVAWKKWQHKFFAWRKKREEAQESAAHRKDPDRYLAREMAIDRARQRMQERYNRTAEEWAEKQKELDEKKRQEKVELWEQQQRGEGSGNRLNYSARSSTSTSGSGATANSTADKKSGKPRLRPEYNPMTGDIGSGSCRWTPGRRGASGGG